ncbi:hypothetical protein [Arthrobacter wenxiniae]|uniref:Uncharacterized protein n=1 Tax=Arthrobacter wenxiniae TaxID=2713570 RepID=A0A7Y7IDN3_9MICC|nr:hypothetical protein [Arthrobacter wenxiniae]NVM93373.1 hypothetical protein [Arthrobacter wenxiniae]
MEYLVPLVIVLVIVIAVIVGARVMGRRGRAMQDAQGPGPRTAAPAQRRPRATREMAVEASAKLSPEAHRAVYSLIARQQVLDAVKAYRKATNSSLGQSAAAVAALAEFPQPLPDPVAAEAPLLVEDILEAVPKPAVPKPAVPKPAEAKPAEPGPAAGAYRYRAIVSRGEEVREVASTRLNEEVFGRIRSLALSGDLDGAAGLLRDHADISGDDAREFVSMIGLEE